MTRRVSRSSFVLALVGGSLAACGAEGGPASEAGVAESWDARTAVLTEEARIDGAAVDLGPTRGVLVAEDGTIAVGQPQVGEIWFFDSVAGPPRTVGGRGEGPGEFTFLAGIGWVADTDTLWAFDLSQARLTYFSQEGEVLRTQAVPATLGWEGSDLGSPTPIPVSIGSDGTLYSEFLLAGSADVPAVLRDSTVIARIAPSGAVQRMVARVPKGDGNVSITSGTYPRPFPNSGLVAASRSGDRFAGAIASLEGPEAGTFSLTVWDAEGEALWSRNHSFEPRPIPPGVADSAYDAARERAPAPFREEYDEAVEMPTTYPPLSDLLVGEDGTVWLAMREGEEGRPHAVFDEQGRPVGTVTVPRGGRVAVARRNAIWVVERDDLDVESIVQYSVTW